MSHERYVKYPFVIEPAAGNLAASAVQFATLATASDRGKLERLMSEQLALELFNLSMRGESYPPPTVGDEIDLSEYEEGSELIYVGPAQLNWVSLTIEFELERQGVSHSELAGKMGVPRSVISRLTNPFYWGHSVKSLNEIASALGVQLMIQFLDTNRDRIEMLVSDHAYSGNSHTDKDSKTTN